MFFNVHVSVCAKERSATLRLGRGRFGWHGWTNRKTTLFLCKKLISL